MAKKKILLISTMVLPLPDVEGGGIERLITMLIKQNEKHGLAELIILSRDSDEAKKNTKGYKHTKIIYKKRKNKIIERLFMYTYVAFNKILGIKLPYFDPNYLCLPKLVKDIKPDFISFEGSGGENCVSLLKIIGRSKMYLHLHHMYSPNNTLNKTFGNIISTSKFIEDNWGKYSHENNYEKEILYNCIDLSRFDSNIKDKYKIRKELGYDNKEFIVLFCGRVVEEKGVKELISAFLEADIVNSKLLVIGGHNAGSNSMLDYYNEVIDLCKGNDNIEHIGYVNNDKLKDYYMLSDVLVIPSLCEEAAGLVAIEGMACGTPIIAARSGGMPEYIGDAAIIIEKDDMVNNLVKQLKILSEDNNLREELSAKGRERAKLFPEERYYFEFMKIFGIGN